jgi:hypothetical protein
VGQALPHKADAKTAGHDDQAVAGDGFKMLPGFHNAPSSRILYH